MSVDFVYDMNAKRTLYSEGELLRALEAFVAQAKPGEYRVRDFRGWAGRPCSWNCIVQRFGSWQAALRRVGVEWRGKTRLDEEELITELERVWREIGRPPGVKELGKRTGLSASPYNLRWGSLQRACGLVALHHRGKLTRPQLLKGKSRAMLTQVPLSQRWRVIKRDGYRCVVCGKNPVADPSVVLHVDHIVPRSCGGGNSDGNLRTLCEACNRGRGNEKKRGTRKGGCRMKAGTSTTAPRAVGTAASRKRLSKGRR